MASISRLYTFVAGTVAEASQVNAELNQIVAAVNTLDGSHIADAAAIDAVEADVEQAQADILTNAAAINLRLTTANAGTLYKNVTFNPNDGKFTFTKYDDTTTVIETNLEKVPVSYTYDETNKALIITMTDGTTTTIPVADLFNDYTFTDSATIDFTKTHTEVSGQDTFEVTAVVKDGSITESKLEATILTTIQGYANTATLKAAAAAASASAASESASAASTSATNAANSATEAGSSATVATTKASEASTSAANALSSENNAAASEASAEASETAAATSESNALSYKNAAITAKNAAETAKTNAETAETNAETAETNAATSEANALSYKEAAETAKSDAITAKNAAETAKTNAETAETNAETAETNAESSAEDSEAWAKGTRNGVDVASTDPAYHNNSKYYKEQAADIVGGDFATTSYVDAAVDGRVAKVDGKGLSTNDYTTSDKDKVANTPADTNAALAGKAPTTHTHEIASVTGLQDALNAADELFIITASFIDDGRPYIAYTFDKTNAEIFAAIDAGKICIIKDNYYDGVWNINCSYTYNNLRYAEFMYLAYKSSYRRFTRFMLTFCDVDAADNSSSFQEYDVVKNSEYTATIGTTWVGTAAPYTQDVSVNGLAYRDVPIIDLVETTQSDELEAAWANIYRIVPDDDLITVYSKEANTVEIPIHIKVVK